MKPHAHLIAFLKALEKAIPRKRDCPHRITFSEYGSDESGWIPELAIDITLANSGERVVYLDDGDFDMPIARLVRKVRAICVSAS